MRVLNEIETREALRDLALDAPAGAGFAFSNRARDTFYDWHSHDYHQLLYAITGATQLETAEARFLLPPQRAAWIPAGVRHRTMVSNVDGVSLYFQPASVPAAGERVRILVATPVMREMILHALRWPNGESEADPVAQSYFTTLALMCGEWLESELPLGLPRAGHPAIARAMDFAAADPGVMNLAGAIAAAGMSERTFRRVFARETGMTWQVWLSQARMMAAMGRLAQGARVTDVAAEVGFASLSAFAKAFTELAGENPTTYRKRVAARRV
jgi:AraC-like DNA-binding protein/mannose-6-phosphate isomerase-like protein (cupin superfamily)